MIPKNLKRTAEWKAKDILFCIAHEDAGSRLWVGSSDFAVYEIDAAQEKPERVRLAGEGHQSYVTGMVRFGKTLVTCSYDRHLIWWDLESQQQMLQVEAHDQWIRGITLTADRARLITVADDMQCKVWDAKSGAEVSSFTDHQSLTPHHYPSMLYAVAASPDGQWIATGDRIGHVAVWDALSFEKVGELEAPVMYTWDPRQRRHSIGGIRSLAFSPDSSRLAVGGIGKIGNIDHLGGPARLEVFDWSTGVRQLVVEDTKKKGLIEQIVWSADQDWIMTVGGDHNGFITVYDSEKGELIHQDGQSGHIHAVSCDPQFGDIYAASHERVTRWTMQTG